MSLTGDYHVDLSGPGLTGREAQARFGKLQAKATLAVWRVQATDEPIVAEFGYQLKFDSPEVVRRKHREMSEFFYTGLQARAADWVQRGTTKTALIYGYGNTSLKHQE